MKTYLFILIYIFPFSIDVSAIDEIYLGLKNNHVARTTILRLLLVNMSIEGVFRYSFYVHPESNSNNLSEKDLANISLSDKLKSTIAKSLDRCYKNNNLEENDDLNDLQETPNSFVSMSFSLVDAPINSASTCSFRPRQSIINEIFDPKPSNRGDLAKVSEEILGKINETNTFKKKSNRRIFYDKTTGSLLANITDQSDLTTSRIDPSNSSSFQF